MRSLSAVRSPVWVSQMTLTPEERTALTRVHAFVLSHGTAGLDADAGRVLADVLRRVLIDVDDVTIGRVAFQVAEYLKELAEKNASDVTAVASDQLLLAALELTAVEWQQ
jgi:hypothetical protein